MRKIILNCRTSEKRAAVLEDGKLTEIYNEAGDDESIVGNIYKGRVEKVIPGMQAAFVTIGHEKNGFLQIDQVEAYKQLESFKKEHVSIASLLHEGQELVVQVLKDGFGEKGPRLTTIFALQGRFVVYMPNDSQVAVSKKIDDQERESWRTFGQSICSEPEGVIFRTACAGMPQETIRHEIEFLKKKWADLINQTPKKLPCLLYNSAVLLEQLVRDYIGGGQAEIVVDDGAVFRTLKDRLSIYNHVGFSQTQISHYMNKEDIFSYFGIEQELNRIVNPLVTLEHGASLMIEQTEALTVIDVNTGKFTGKYNARETILKTNEMAAVEIARQLRLRNIGGIILVDFINMDQEKDREFIKNKLIAALRADRNYTKVLGFTKLGLLELTRKKERKSLLEKLTTACPTCNGTGRVYSSEQIAFRIDRALWEYKGMDHEALWLEAPSDVASLWKTNNHIGLMEEALGFKVFITDNDRFIDQFEVRHIGSENEVKTRIYKKQNS